MCFVMLGPVEDSVPSAISTHSHDIVWLIYQMTLTYYNIAFTCSGVALALGQLQRHSASAGDDDLFWTMRAVTKTPH
jgi:hypothetical protein